MNAGYCWYNSAVNQNCNSVCSAHGGVYGGTCDWVNDPVDCSTCLHFYAGMTACHQIDWGPVAWPGGSECYFHTDGHSNCGHGEAETMRQCACER